MGRWSLRCESLPHTSVAAGDFPVPLLMRRGALWLPSVLLAWSQLGPGPRLALLLRPLPSEALPRTFVAGGAFPVPLM
eukprot:8644971-Heterocapsa_arctica.AAC.1